MGVAEAASKHNAVEARKRLARLIDTQPTDVFWVKGWTTLRSAPADRIKLQARSTRPGFSANVHADHPALVKNMVELAEKELGTVSDEEDIFWAEYRFMKI